MLAIVLLASLAACDGEPSTGPDHVVRFPGAGAALNVRVADSDTERAQGLMGVDELPAGEGMAFVWPEPVEGTFWMKDTLIPLSIAFVGADDRIVTITEMIWQPARAHFASVPPTLNSWSSGCAWMLIAILGVYSLFINLSSWICHCERSEAVFLQCQNLYFRVFFQSPASYFES